MSCVFARKLESELTPGRRQSKTLLTIDEHGSKIAGNSVFDCYLSSIRRQMAIENCFVRFLANFVDSIDVFDCRLPGVELVRHLSGYCSNSHNPL